jgi:hypothetical protein
LLPIVAEFIGLIVWSSQLTRDHRLVAEAPKITNPAAQVMSMSRAGVPNPWGGIEDHVTVIAYKKSDRVAAESTAAWAGQTLVNHADYEYVVLSGERIRIYATPTSGAAVRSDRAVADSTDWRIKMPHLVAANLKPQFSEAGNFAGATVFEVDGGRRSGCKVGNRVDVAITFPEAKITIEAMSPVREKIVLRGTRFFVGNVPGSSLRGNDYLGSMAHSDAYSRMSVTPSPGMVPESGRFLDLLPCATPWPPIDLPIFINPNHRGTDYQCSNVVW